MPESKCLQLPTTTPFINSLLHFCILLSLVNLKNELGSEGTPSFLIIQCIPDILVAQGKE